MSANSVNTSNIQPTTARSAIAKQSAAMSLAADSLPTASASKPTFADLRRALPIPSFHLSRSLEGTNTDLLIQEYDDRILVLVTQNGKIGCLTQATLPSSITIIPPSKSNSATSTSTAINSHPSLSILPHLPPPSPSLSLLPILGSPPTPETQTLNDMYVSQAAALVWWLMEMSGAEANGGNGRKAVVVGLTLGGSKKAGLGAVPSEVVDEDEDGELDEEIMGMDTKERIRFAGVMGMIAEWDAGSPR